MNDTYSFNRDDRLEDALALQAAGIPVAEILAEAGSDAEWLRPMLEMAAEVEGLQQVIPIPPPAASLQRMLAYGKEISTGIPPEMPTQPWWRINWPDLRANWQVAVSGSLLVAFLAISLLAGLLAGGILGGGLVLAAEDSLPGESLYPVKQLGESARLFLAGDPVQRQRLLEDFNQRRQQEAQQLLDTGRGAEVSFNGWIESATATEIIIAGLTVHITPDTIVEGQLAAGAQVSLQGVIQTSDGLVALTITVLMPAPPSPTPTATQTPTTTRTTTVVKPAATEEPAADSTSDTIIIEPTFTPTATPTPTATATRVKPTSTPIVPSSSNNDTITPSPTASPTTAAIVPLVTQTPAGAILNGGGDNNDNVDDNENDNTRDSEDSHTDDQGNDNDSDNSGSDSNNSGSGDSGDDSSGGEGSGDHHDDEKEDDISASGGNDHEDKDNSGSGSSDSGKEGGEDDNDAGN